MHAVLLAAGLGRRLGPDAGTLPKALLRFGGKSLLRRHLEILRRLDVAGVTLVTGYRADDLRAEVAAVGASEVVTEVFNPRYEAGSILSLLAARETLAAGGEILLMDADVLYDDRLLRRLTTTRHADAMLLDRDIEPGEEPVKICLRQGRMVDFAKQPTAAFDAYGESVGFFRLSPATARGLVAAADAIVAAGAADAPYEEAIRALVRTGPAGPFGWEDITGLPWIEIDFPEDVRRAEAEVLPRLEEAPSMLPNSPV